MLNHHPAMKAVVALTPLTTPPTYRRESQNLGGCALICNASSSSSFFPFSLAPLLLPNPPIAMASSSAAVGSPKAVIPKSSLLRVRLEEMEAQGYIESG